jgi:hypothetical protein
MLEEDMNALYIVYQVPSAAVIFARDWVRERARAAGLVMFEAIPPTIRGFQWTMLFAPAAAGRQEVELPPNAGLSDVDTIRVRSSARRMLVCRGWI